MKIRTALLLSVLLSALTEAALAAPQSLDPDQAPIAAVDRFSAAAAHLQVRTSDNGIPGPNQPVDFDKGPFITVGLSPVTGKPVSYYNFDVQSVTPAPVYVLYHKDGIKPVAGQLDIIDTLPGEKGYNDFRQVHKVLVPDGYIANTITDAASLLKSGYEIRKTDALRNVPVVPDKSVAKARLKGESAQLQRGWYHRKIAKYFSFSEAPLLATASEVPVSPIYVTFNKNPDQPNGGPPSGFLEQSKQSHNVPATLPSDDGYSPLWSVNVYDNADFPKVRDLDTALQAKLLAPGVATVNCPIVSITP